MADKRAPVKENIEDIVKELTDRIVILEQK